MAACVRWRVGVFLVALCVRVCARVCAIVCFCYRRLPEYPLESLGAADMEAVENPELNAARTRRLNLLSEGRMITHVKSTPT